MKHVVFVDDEPNVLNGLKRMLRPMRREWDMDFYEEGSLALASMEKRGCDVIVSDMRMPKMDGAQLLSETKKMHPGSIRIALSGESEPSMVYRCIKHSHQYLAKPCDADQLIATINRACALQDMLADDQLKILVSNLESIPTLPESYKKIMGELQSDDTSLQTVGAIIESDIAMTAKVLQIVNSAYFGLPRYVSSPSEAALYLGLDAIKTLVLANGVFTQFDQETIDTVGLNEIWSRSMHIGALAKIIAIEETGDRILGDYALMAGLLCDVGTLVMAVEFPEQIDYARQRSERQNRPVYEVERELFGHSHMEVGAYLVALWGLPNPIVEAVAYHHSPDECRTNEFSPLTAVHIANSIVNSSDIDKNYIRRLVPTQRLPHWHTLWQSMQSNKESESDG